MSAEKIHIPKCVTHDAFCQPRVVIDNRQIEIAP